MGVGRFLCVALPFALTVGSLIFMLAATLGGVANSNLFLFQVNLTDLSINPLDIPELNLRSLDALAVHDAPAKTARSLFPTIKGVQSGGNVTAGELGLGNLYDISLWGYCVTGQNGTRTCTKAKFDWAREDVNATAQQLQTLASQVTGKPITLPKSVTDAVSLFATLTKWSEVAFIASLICLAVELFFGIFANCSRVFSCLTFIVAGITMVVVVGAASLATAMAAVVVGTVETTARWYGVHSSLNTTFLALIWLSAALSIGAGFFWLFTICCCAPSHHSRRDRKRNTADAEKLLPTGAYAPLHENQHQGFYNNAAAPQYGAPRYPSGGRADIAYEPYSHSR